MSLFYGVALWDGGNRGMWNSIVVLKSFDENVGGKRIAGIAGVVTDFFER